MKTVIVKQFPKLLGKTNLKLIEAYAQLGVKYVEVLLSDGYSIYVPMEDIIEYTEAA